MDCKEKYVGSTISIENCCGGSTPAQVYNKPAGGAPKSAHASLTQTGMGGLYVMESSLLQFSPRPGDSSACSGDNLNSSKSPFSFSDIQPTNFANVEDMLFEVFRCEETDTINNIAIAQFLKANIY